MPKLKKYPKAPKAGASMTSLKRWEDKCKEVKKHNDGIEKERDAKTKIRENVRKMKA